MHSPTTRGGPAWLVFMLVVLTAAVAVGCGSSSGGSEKGGASGVAEKGTLKVAALVGVSGDRAKKLAPVFEKEHPGIKVQVTPIAYENVFPKEILDASQNTARYDVYTVNNAQLGVYAASNHIIPLDDYIKNPKLAPSDLALDDYYPSYIDGMTKYNGKQYTMPYSFWLLDFYYRKDKYSDPKVKAAYKSATGKDLALPKTFDEMRNQAKFFTGKGQYGFGMDGLKGGPGANVYQFIPFLWNWGGDILDKANKCAVFNSPQAVQALDFYKTLVPYSPPSYLQNIADQNTSLFQQGKLMLSLHDSDQFGYINDKANSKPEVVNHVGLAVSPSGPKGDPPAIHMAGWTMGVNADSKMKRAAAEYVMWMAAKGRAPVQAGFGEPQARKSWLANPANQKAHPEYQAMVDSLPNARSVPPVPGWAKIQDAFALAIQSAVTGQKSSKSALDDAVSQSNKALGCS
jgi:multiple sugar transport system substrate-binding protein